MKIQTAAEYLTVEWWKWALSIPRSKNPIYDYTGKMVRHHQRNDIFFLAGTTEHVSGSAVRTCTIPKDKLILIPLFNAIVVRDDQINSEQRLRETTTQLMNSIIFLSSYVDTLELADMRKYRIQSKPFDVKVKKNNFLSLAKGHHIAISDGYWIMLSEMESGNHIVRFRGESNQKGHEFKQDVTYHITIT